MASKRFAVLTCGGVCPGLNDVVRSITFRSYQCGVSQVYGVRYGFKGLNDISIPDVPLSPSVVKMIHHRGGTFLGTSREPLDPNKAIHTMQERGYDALFVIGGNGGNAAAAVLHDAIREHKLPMQVIGLPKSIDNDINHIDKCFGFDTAVHEARKVLEVARNEADAVYKGVCVVKVMGRESGFIAHNASKEGMADVCLVPESPLDMNVVLRQVSDVLMKNASCVVCVAEGFPITPAAICDMLTSASVYVKYIDPSYILRGGICIPEDRNFCYRLGVAAVDVALQGLSGVTVATLGGHMSYFQTKDIVRSPKRLPPRI